MGNPGLFSVHVHWAHWALPLAVTLPFQSKEFNITIGPVMFSLCWAAHARGDSQ